MKIKLMLLTIVSALIGGCDFYKEDVPVVINYKMNYLPNQPIMVDLGSVIDQGKSQSFIIKDSPSSGSAEILAKSFMVYSPKGGNTDKLRVDILDSKNIKIGEAIINLEASPNACGIAKFDGATVLSGNEIVVNLTHNDQYCDSIREIVLIYTPFENADGLMVTIPLKQNPSDPNEQSRIELRYKAPAGFKGIAKGLYIAAINLKEEYRDQWNTDEMMIHPTEKFQYFVASMVEINVE